jgi:hypothetical protein
VDFDSRDSTIIRRLHEIAQHTGASVIDPVTHLCSASECGTNTPEGMPIYLDDDHLRSGYVRKGATFMDPVLGDLRVNPFLTAPIRK